MFQNTALLAKSHANYDATNHTSGRSAEQAEQAGRLRRQNNNNKRTYDRLMLLALSLVMVMFFCAFVTHLFGERGVQASERKAGEPAYVYVEAGDSLWSIAAEHAGESRDLRKYVYEMQRINGLRSATIYEGQKLLLPD